MAKKRATRRVSSPQKKVRKKVTRSDKNLSPFSLVLYGPSGIGKSSTIAQFPDTRFILEPEELGVKILAERGLIPEPAEICIVETWDELLTEIHNTEDVSNLCLEAITGIEQLGFRWECDEHFGGDMSKHGFFNYQQGPKNFAKFTWPKLLRALDKVMSRGINVALTGHSRVRPTKNPSGHDYDSHQVYCDVETWQNTKRWAQVVGFFGLHVDVNAEKKVLESDRVIQFDAAPYYDAKNWIGLNSPMIAEGEPVDVGKELYRQLIGE